MLGRVTLAGRRCTAVASVVRQPLLRARPLHSLGEVEGVHSPLGQYSHGVVFGPGHKMAFLSGQVGIDADGNVPETAGEQAELCFGAIKLLLADAGMSSKDGASQSNALRLRNEAPTRPSTRRLSPSLRNGCCDVLFVQWSRSVPTSPTASTALRTCKHGMSLSVLQIPTKTAMRLQWGCRHLP